MNDVLVVVVWLFDIGVVLYNFVVVLYFVIVQCFVWCLCVVCCVYLDVLVCVLWEVGCDLVVLVVGWWLFVVCGCFVCYGIGYCGCIGLYQMMLVLFVLVECIVVWVCVGEFV